MRKTNVRT